MKKVDLGKIEKFIKEVAKEAGMIARDHFDIKEDKEITFKKANNKQPVSKIDLEINEFIINKIKGKYPNDQIYSEESAHYGITDNHYWIIDPIDGTRNYLEGKDKYSVTIAFALNGKIEMGVIFFPNLNEFYFSKRGQKFEGATKNNDVVFGKSWDENIISIAKAKFNNDKLVYSACATYDLVQVALGRGSGAIYQNINLWDFAAGSLMITESGGKITDFEGNDFEVDESFDFQPKNLIFYAKK